MTDPVGGDVFARALECYVLEARVVPISWAGSEGPHLQPEEILSRNLTVVGVAWSSTYPRKRRDLVLAVHGELVHAYVAGRVSPVAPESGRSRSWRTRWRRSQTATSRQGRRPDSGFGLTPLHAYREGANLNKCSLAQLRTRR